MQPLAIVIPAYKPDFFDATLRSLAAQTRRDFTVYVGDDASPHDLRALCEAWRGTLDIRYHRFERNLGREDLVGHWQRCIALGDEPWVWLFSDDDLLEPGCVAAFLERVAADPHPCQVYHFNVCVIDADGSLLKEAPPFPDRLPVREFVRQRFAYALQSFAPDYVFSRQALVAAGGFQAFPRAWCSDDATWVKLAGDDGIVSIAGPRVHWRSSGQNISTSHGPDRWEKLEAGLQYLEWLRRYLLAHPASGGAAADAALLDAGRWWLYAQAETLRVTFRAFGLLRTARRFQHLFGSSLPAEALRIALQDSRILRRLASRSQ